MPKLLSLLLFAALMLAGVDGNVTRADEAATLKTQVATFQKEVATLRAENEALRRSGAPSPRRSSRSPSCVGFRNMANDLSARLNHGTFVGGATATSAQLLLLKVVLAVEVLLPAAPPQTKVQLQSTTNFASGNWINLGGIVTSNAEENGILDSVRRDEKKFYRIVVVP